MKMKKNYGFDPIMYIARKLKNSNTVRAVVLNRYVVESDAIKFGGKLDIRNREDFNDNAAFGNKR